MAYPLSEVEQPRRLRNTLPAVRPYEPNFTMPGAAPEPAGSVAPPQRTALNPVARAGNALRSVGPQVLDAAVGGVAGAAAAAGVNSLRQGQLNTRPAFQAPPEAPGQIPGADPRYKAPPAAAGSLLSQSETGRNIGNIVNALPALRGPAGAFTRAGAATNTLRFAAPLAVASATGRGYVAGDAAFPGTAPAPAAPTLSQTPTVRAPVTPPTAPPAPPDLTGKIVRDGNNYSGSNIRFGGDIVDPNGRVLNGGNLRDPKGFGVSSLDTSEGFRQNLLELERNAAERAAAPVGGVGGFNTSDPIDALRAKQNAGRPTTRVERMSQAGQAVQRENAQASVDASLRGQELSAATSRANNQANVRATLRGQDMDYAEKLDAKKMDLAAKQAQRTAIAAAWKGTSDPMVAARRLAAAGYDPASALAVGGGQRAGVEATDKALEGIVDAAGADTKSDGTGYINPAKKAVAKAVITDAAPGVAGAPPEEVATAAPRLRAIGNLGVGLQEAQGGSLFETLGIDQAPPPISALPNFKGATLRERTLSDGAFSPFSNASRGDYMIVQPDGTEMPIKRSRIGQRELDYLKSNGVTLRSN